jgi:hypothetical protein
MSGRVKCAKGSAVTSTASRCSHDSHDISSSLPFPFRQTMIYYRHPIPCGSLLLSDRLRSRIGMRIGERPARMQLDAGRVAVTRR